jgi:hypothetical protein
MAVLSDTFALDDAPDALIRSWSRNQRLGSATMLDTKRTNCLKCAGAWITDCGASSESARVRTGTAVFKRLGYRALGKLVHEAATSEAYLCAHLKTRGARDVIGARRSDVAHAVFADLVFLLVVFYL